MSEAERAGTSRQDESARLLAGRYRLGGVLGRGGMGTVWRAEDETLGRTVAVKELRFPTNIDEEEKRRLITRTLREAKAIARIRNNSAVTVFDVVEEDDRPWIVMELVEGKSLAEVIREDGLLEPRRAAEVGLAILDVLRSAHREGILHRDVKPSNVLIADDGRVVLTDFGIAQVEGDPSITSTGMLVGAPSYISPERARGHKPGPAADLWSLGGLLYASVEGVPPYDKGSAIATLTAVMTETLEEPKNAGPLRDVIYGLLTKDPALRLDDAGARALLTKVVHAPAGGREPDDATKVVPLPAQPGGRREESGDRLRGALRSVRKAASGAGASGAARTATASPSAGAPAASAPAGAPASPAVPGARTTAPGGRGSGWPVMPPPDLPPAPVRRAPLTDVVPRRTLIAIAVVVVLAVLGTVLALTLGDDDLDGAKGAGDRPTASAGASGDTKRDDDGDTRTDGSAAPAGGTRDGGGSDDPAGNGSEATGATGGDATDGAADAGGDDAAGGGAGAVSTHQGTQGYSIGLPEGWSYASTGSAGDRFTGPGGQKLLVAWTTTPKGDPVADWKNQERYMVRSQYRKVRIEKVDYRNWNTADWEFTYTEGGTGYRTIDRGFVVSDRAGYALMYTARAADWDGDQRVNAWKVLTETFRPKD
ncbi:serine/threonine-protein kinase [Streptomyces tagetis]|uniref:non-specific serine/threonine protein kinase n=1 Tax=Streptomyces tagetis TaxID=2820809 RepID=A0A940XPG8_9ACTN|nr:serine/threonine-protein kinase [Streptomyces sp. RG38]MBQ0828635.1 serine/threonine protein kinase [Streptomyces sp. RG38]